MKEVYRCKKVYDGVTHAAKLYPNAYIIMIIIGTIKGNGAGFTRLMERLIRGVWTPTAMEFMQPTLSVDPNVAFPSHCFILQLHQSLAGRFDNLHPGQEDWSDLGSTRAGLLRNRDIPRVLQAVLDSAWHPRSVCSIREFDLRPLLRRDLGFPGEDFWKGPDQRRGN